MNWREHKKLAICLRNQGLADCVAARFALRPSLIDILGDKTSLAHLVVAKSQQSVEKLMKGFLLWSSKSFDPTKGHTPFTNSFELPESQRNAFKSIYHKLNRLNRSVITELKWLESLAPRIPETAPQERGNLQSLSILPENTEYPFWSLPENDLVTSANGLTMENHGVRAIKAVRTFLSAMSRSDPPQFTKHIGIFLDNHPFSTAISVWPES